ncbi:MAG: hypothetical protein KGO53_15155 [Alphaproteobacteria bacterium]|nr:hypothetical protein [Alphaproteobacteria bacterium]
MALLNTLAGLFQGFSPRREIRRIHSQLGDRRITFFLRRDRRFEFTVEKFDATAQPEKDLSVRQWRETYQSEPFDSLIEAKESAASSFTWVPLN